MNPEADQDPIVHDIYGRPAVQWHKMLEGLTEQVNTLRAENVRLTALVDAADEFGDQHVIELKSDGWVIAHPLSCRAAGLFDCPVNAAAHDLSGPPAGSPPLHGRFEVTVNAGHLVIGERIL